MAGSAYMLTHLVLLIRQQRRKCVLAVKKLYKDQWDKKISGVIGGLGAYFNIDPAFLRLIVLVLFIPTGVFILPLIYFIAAIFLPIGPNHYIKPKCKRLFRSQTDRKLGGVIGGLAEYFRIDSNLLRLIVIILMIVTGFFPVAIAYLVSCMIISLKP